MPVRIDNVSVKKINDINYYFIKGKKHQRQNEKKCEDSCTIGDIVENVTKQNEKIRNVTISARAGAVIGIFSAFKSFFQSQKKIRSPTKYLTMKTTLVNSDQNCEQKNSTHREILSKY